MLGSPKYLNEQELINVENHSVLPEGKNRRSFTRTGILFDKFKFGSVPHSAAHISRATHDALWKILSEKFENRARKVKLELISNEALVLIEFLLRFRDKEELKIYDKSEEQVLWNLCAMLESHVPELLDEDYSDILIRAQKSIKAGDQIQ